MPGRSLAQLIVLMSLTGCIGITGAYIDPTLPPASAADVRAAAHPTAVQLLVEFRAKDAPKADAASQVRARIAKIAQQSGLFSSVSAEPVEGGRRLVITVIDSAGEQKGSPVATGLTLGLAGTKTTDKYHVDVRYDIPGRDAVSLTYEHALIGRIGVAAAPEGLTSYPIGVAAAMIFDQIGWSIMRDLAARHATEELGR
jgi:hypothetical protein